MPLAKIRVLEGHYDQGWNVYQGPIAETPKKRGGKALSMWQFLP